MCSGSCMLVNRLVYNHTVEPHFWCTFFHSQCLTSSVLAFSLFLHPAQYNFSSSISISITIHRYKGTCTMFLIESWSFWIVKSHVCHLYLLLLLASSTQAQPLQEMHDTPRNTNYLLHERASRQALNSLPTGSRSWIFHDPLISRWNFSFPAYTFGIKHHVRHVISMFNLPREFLKQNIWHQAFAATMCDTYFVPLFNTMTEFSRVSLCTHGGYCGN